MIVLDIVVLAIAALFAWVMLGLFVYAVRTDSHREIWRNIAPFILWWRKP